jgi:hypothetical protein
MTEFNMSDIVKNTKLNAFHNTGGERPRKGNVILLHILGYRKEYTHMTIRASFHHLPYVRQLRQSS